MVRASQSTKRGKQKWGLERKSWVPDGFPAPVSYTHLCACLQEPKIAPATYCKAPFIFRLARASKSFLKPKESKLPLNERSTLHIHLNNKGREKHKIKNFSHWHRQRFLIKSRNYKEKVIKLEFTKIKTFCSLKDIAKKTQRQARNWEKIFTIHISDKKIISRIQGKLLPLSKTNNSVKNGQKTWTDSSEKESYKWWISTWKDAQNH